METEFVIISKKNFRLEMIKIGFVSNSCLVLLRTYIGFRRGDFWSVETPFCDRPACRLSRLQVNTFQAISFFSHSCHQTFPATRYCIENCSNLSWSSLCTANFLSYFISWSAQQRKAEETMEGKSQRSSLALISGRTGVSLKRRLRRRRRYTDIRWMWY